MPLNKEIKPLNYYHHHLVVLIGYIFLPHFRFPFLSRQVLQTAFSVRTEMMKMSLLVSKYCSGCPYVGVQYRLSCIVRWGSRIRQLHLWRRRRPSLTKLLVGVATRKFEDGTVVSEQSVSRKKIRKKESRNIDKKHRKKDRKKEDKNQ